MPTRADWLQPVLLPTLVNWVVTALTASSLRPVSMALHRPTWYSLTDQGL